MTNILFICKWNRFRSKVAEAIFNKLNKNKNNYAKSAGIISGFPINKKIFEACKKSGYPISKKIQGTNYPLLMWSDIVIIIEPKIPKILFEELINPKDKKIVLEWNIKDTTDYKQRYKLIKNIERKVKLLIKKLK